MFLARPASGPCKEILIPRDAGCKRLVRGRAGVAPADSSKERHSGLRGRPGRLARERPRGSAPYPGGVGRGLFASRVGETFPGRDGGAVLSCVPEQGLGWHPGNPESLHRSGSRRARGEFTPEGVWLAGSALPGCRSSASGRAVLYPPAVRGTLVQSDRRARLVFPWLTLRMVSARTVGTALTPQSPRGGRCGGSVLSGPRTTKSPNREVEAQSPTRPVTQPSAGGRHGHEAYVSKTPDRCRIVQVRVCWTTLCLTSATVLFYLADPWWLYGAGFGMLVVGVWPWMDDRSR